MKFVSSFNRKIELGGGEMKQNISREMLRNDFGNEEILGVVDEEELLLMSGGNRDIQPQTTWPCAWFTLISAAQCPTLACSSKCFGQ